jgi:hypothetical protein
MCEEGMIDAEDNELWIDRKILADLKKEYSPALPNGMLNENNDLRILNIIEMLERCASINEGHTKLLIT